LYQAYQAKNQAKLKHSKKIEDDSLFIIIENRPLYILLLQ